MSHPRSERGPVPPASGRGLEEDVDFAKNDGLENTSDSNVLQHYHTRDALTIVPASPGWRAYRYVRDDIGRRLHGFSVIAWAVPVSGPPIPVTIQGFCPDSLIERANDKGDGIAIYLDGHPYILAEDAVAAFDRREARHD